ncbi:CAP domain-containing protein [Cohnella yongneupensis]|uniref:CAP domain-containing protein n=1 Tax=Cohnella yongneupensis TaxID=425006 RepID=A0ABW0R5K4_9BACL
MNKQPNKVTKTLLLGAMALTLSLPIGAAGAFAASNNNTITTSAPSTILFNFDLNAFLQQYMQGFYTQPSKPVTTPSKPVTTTPSKPVTTPSKPVTTTPSKPVTTPAQPAKPAQPSQGANSGTVATSEYATQVVTLVNQERAKAGLKPLATTNSTLKLVALDKAKDMYNNNYFDHNSPTFGSPFDMMKQYGVTFRSAGENIAKGQRSPQEVMTAWMNSQGHRANILNASFTTIGVAYYNGVWVQEFIG